MSKKSKSTLKTKHRHQAIKGLATAKSQADVDQVIANLQSPDPGYEPDYDVDGMNDFIASLGGDQDSNQDLDADLFGGDEEAVA